MKLYLGHQRAEDRISKINQIIEDNTHIQYGYSKSVIEVNRLEKPSKITWSDEMQERLSRRGLQIENRVNEPKWFTRNETIMDMVAKYVKELNLGYDIIAPINQVRISKRIMLPCELVGFKGDRKTKEARYDKEQSSVLWKIQFEKVPKLSKKLYELWRSFVDWLLTKRIEIIVDFDNEIETVYKMSSDRKYIKNG